MLNLIKYELKGYTKEIIISLGVIIILNLMLLTRIKVWEDGVIVFLSYMITCATSISVFIWNISLFSRDIYKDSGYLLFTLPETGYSILGSKLLTSLIQSIVMGAVAILFNFIIFTQITSDWKGILSKISEVVSPGFIMFTVVSAVVYMLYFLTTVYFSISLSKVAIRNKKLGKLGAFGIFVVLSIIVSEFLSTISKIFPETFSVDIVSSKLQNTMYGMHGVDVNMASLIFQAILFIVLFIATSYILENKIDL
ncbi:hypothetical protein HBE96_08555 [Clostridium sp. P21]|uniref:Uncharacterized protein n=1 Tax=Clostridium muellerianum TaxID=2716538 RepID=A0A7Y0HN21_9CLOT|nr:hypothetical protein [Clostridium muellerianum]NMM62745.1 hypothetical protein [Clostridium muellerianum]